MKLDTIRRHAMAMEAVTEEPHHDFSSFRVAKDAGPKRTRAETSGAVRRLPG